MIKSDEATFWRYWLAGLFLFAVMVAMNPFLATLISPMGISDHQAAPNAMAVDAIQNAWRENGMLTLARISMVIDLVFIGIYSRGALAGGLMFRRSGVPALKWLGLIIATCAIVFCITDYLETISQIIQVMSMRGSDLLAGIASNVRPVKTIAFLVTFVGLLTALLLRRMTAKAG